MKKHNVLLQDDLAGTGEDTAQARRGVHWGLIVIGIGLGMMLFLTAVLVFIFMRTG